MILNQNARDVKSIDICLSECNNKLMVLVEQISVQKYMVESCQSLLPERMRCQSAVFLKQMAYWVEDVVTVLSEVAILLVDFAVLVVVLFVASVPMTV